MLLTVFCEPRDSSETTFALDVSPDLELRDFVALCELESGIPAGEIQISHAEQPLRDPTRSLGTYGLKDGDVVVLRQAARRPPAQPAFPGLPRIDFSSIAVPGTSGSPSAQPAHTNTPQQSPAPAPAPVPAPDPAPAARPATSPQGLEDPALLRDMLLANPHELSLLKERNPPLADALLSGDLERFTKVLQEQQQDRARREQERIRLLTADPFDLEAQAKIEEDIRQHNIEENMTIAMEEAPESFGQVVMLYINCKVNGHPVKAFVDSGSAQMTIMSQACAERCNIMRLVDRRWAGIAKGVGTQKIIGRVHLAQVQIEGDFLPCSFSILEDQPMDMLLGLDMLKRHQCSIDLKKSMLLIGTTGSETRFLPEGELPECARLAYGPESRDEPRPEEIADRELAEAIQRSVQESVLRPFSSLSVDTEGGRTTSSQSAPKLFYKPFNKAPTPSASASPSPSTSGGQGRTLDRSQSAPSPLPPVRDPEPTTSPNADSRVPLSDVAVPAPSLLVRDTPPPPPPPPPPSSLQESHCAVPSCSQLVPDTAPSKPQDMQESVPSVQPETHPLPPLTPASLEPPPPPASEPCLKTADPPPSSSPSQDPGLASVTIEEPSASATMGAAKRTCSPPPGEGHDAGGKRSPLPVSSDANANFLPQPRVPLEQPTSEEKMEGPEDELQGRLERDQPEGGSCSSECSSSNGNGNGNSSNNNIPSLAQALKELHELLVSNRTLSPPDCRPDADGVDQPAPRPAPASSTAPVLDTSAGEAQRPRPSETDPGRSVAHAPTPADDPVDAAQSGRATGCRPDASPMSDVCEDEKDGASELGGTSPHEEDMSIREPPEGQQGRGEADGRDFGAVASNLPTGPSDQPSPLSLAVGSSDEEQPSSSSGSSSSGSSSSGGPPSSATTPSSTGSTSPTATTPPPPSAPAAAPPPPPPPLAPPAAERFPAEHIQRIQAAGFSAQEAAQALEQAQGCVELALLVLLARKISVPS
ncbi:hypothetical protein ACEWY4_013217 [Coilia grayii]|uniref:Uncharacterized protein n=1 Tax=Coilia grayii TaxID=363190 RepID=A0ABD1JVN9_9TELE